MTNRYCDLTPSTRIEDDFEKIDIGFDRVQEEMDAKVNANRIINGGFTINQRVVSGTVILSAGQYGHDRWKAGSGGCTYTFSTVNNVTTITITAGSLVQVIEGMNLFNGTYILSWAGTAQGKIGAGSYGAAGITGVVVGGTNLSIEFNIGTLSKVNFNIGDIAFLPFHPRSFAEELALCQRYYEKSYNYDIPPKTAATSIGIVIKVLGSNSVLSNQEYGEVQFKVPKRAIGTVTIHPFTTPANTGRVSGLASGSDFSANTGFVPAVGTSSFRVNNGSGGSFTTDGNGIMFHWSADAEL